jgi:hypothetical protein
VEKIAFPWVSGTILHIVKLWGRFRRRFIGKRTAPFMSQCALRSHRRIC